MDVQMQSHEITEHEIGGEDQRQNSEITLEIGGEDQRQNSMQRELGELPEDPSIGKTISRIPAWLLEDHSILFQPKMICIGPIHHGKEILKAAENHKWRFLKDFLERKQHTVGVYLQKMRDLETKARKCYGETIKMESEEFVEMLVLDGCFILEHLLKLRHSERSAYCNDAWAISALTTDMLLLENQIPFIVIVNLFAAYEGGNQETPHNCQGSSSCELLGLFFKFSTCKSYIEKYGVPEVSCNKGIHHYLDLVHTCMVGAHQNVNEVSVAVGSNDTGLQSNSSNSAPRDSYTATQSMDALANTLTAHRRTRQHNKHVGIQCASMLSEAGVKFRLKENPLHMVDISFNKGTMEIPFLSVNRDKKILFANAAAYEITQILSKPTSFVEYILLMDAIFNTEKDVLLLEKKHIIENMLPSEENVAAFFNDLGGLFVALKYKERDLCNEVMKYIESPYHEYRALLMRNYLNNPWSIISVFAATILLLLTILQTIFSGMQLKQPNKN